MAASNLNDRLAGSSADDIIDGLQGDDFIEGGDGNDTLIGGLGSDVLIGGAGDDVLTGDAVNGARDRFDRDIFVLGDVQNTSIGNDTITDFDTNNFFGGESNFDTLSFTFNNRNFNLSTGLDILSFVFTIEHDGDVDTDAIRDGNDLIFVFARNENGEITDSIRLENIIGDDGVTDGFLNLVSVDDITDQDVFADNNDVDNNIPTPDDDVLSGTSADDTIDGLQGDDVIEGGDGNDTLIGGRGSDILIGGAGDDILTSNEVSGAGNRFDRDIFVLGDVQNTSTGNDTITDFDANNFRGGENNFDTLSLTFDDRDFNLSTGLDIVNFVFTIEHDGDVDTDAIRDGNDLIFVFARNENGEITDSVRLEDVIGTDGVTNGRLNRVSIDNITDQDVFVAPDGGQGGTNTAPTAGSVDLGATNEDTAITFTAAEILANSSDTEGDTPYLSRLCLLQHQLVR